MSRPFFFVLTAAVPLLLYGPTLTFDFVHADDADLIAGNQSFLTDLRNIPRAFTRSYFETEGEVGDLKTYYRPVAIVSFMIDAARAARPELDRGGADPAAYHATNVVLHGAATCLLLALARAWGAPATAALVAALVFAAHPVNVQAVAWIAGRNDLLLAVFGSLALVAWARLSTPNSQSPTSKPIGLGVGSWALGVHVLSFALALFSKETGIFFPAIAVLHQGLVVRARLTRWQSIALAVDGAVVLVWTTLRSQALAGMPPPALLDTVRVAILNVPQLFVHAGKLLAPIRLNVSPGVDATGITLGVVALVIFAVAAYRWLPRAMAIVGACWAMAFWVPTLVVPGLPAYEHRNYLPLIGILLALCAGSKEPAYDRNRRPQLQVQLAAVGVVVVFAMQAYARQEVFRDAFSYWTDATRDAQFAPIAHVNLGQLHESAGNLQQTRREYLRALELDPSTPKAHNDLGVVLMKLDEPDLAVRHFHEEARRHPWNAEAWFNLGLWEELRGNLAAARRHYERAIAENRYYLPAYEKLGKTSQFPTSNSQPPR